jgi:imidazolonepropionase-like amidohydrolase
VTGPAFLGKSARYGALAPGKSADILILDANPLADIAATRAIRTVVLRGQTYGRPALDKLLADARAAAAR